MVVMSDRKAVSCNDSVRVALHCKSGDSVFIYLSPCIVLLNLRERIFEISSFEEVFLI